MTAAPVLVGLDGAPLTADTFAAAPVVERARVWHREPDPAWVATLAALTPKSDVHSWLHLAWEPGDPWPGHEVERWVLFTVRPPSMIAPDVRRALDGPAPRSTGHYCGPRSLCYCHKTQRPDCWVGGATRLIDQRAWELWREIGGYATRWWIVQGTEGGHLYRYSQHQRSLAQMLGQPDAPPVPGELPYADPDAQTWRAVMEHDALTRNKGRLLERTLAELDAAERDEAIAARRQAVAWFRRQCGEAIDEGGADLRRALRAMRGPEVDALADDPDADIEAFITDED